MQNGYIESFNGRFRDECLNEHWFETLHQARTEIAALAARLQRGAAARQHRAHATSASSPSSIAGMPAMLLDTSPRQTTRSSNLQQDSLPNGGMADGGRSLLRP